MLATLLIWTYILFLSFIYGWFCLELLRRLFRIETQAGAISRPIIALLGLGVLNLLAALLSLFIKMGWLAQVLVLLPGLFLAWTWWRAGKRPAFKRTTLFHWLAAVLFVLLFLSVLELGTGPASNPDTGIYHAQAIHWMETYPAVPGLGNLHSRLAYNSNWLVLNAFFSFSFLGLGSFHVLPGIFLLMVLVYFLEGVQKVLQKEAGTAAVLKTLCIPILFYTVGAQTSSPGTDFPVTAWMWVVFALWLEVLETRRRSAQGTLSLEELVLFIFSIHLVTIKLTALPVLLAGLFILTRHARRPWKRAVGLILLAVGIMAPWLARNLILSGYWVYPVPLLSVLSPDWDWKIPLSNVVQEYRVNQAWARIPMADAEKVLAMPFLKWLEEWFLNRTRNQQLLIVAASLVPLLPALMWIIGRSKVAFVRGYFWVFGAAYGGLLFWFLAGPDIRFGYGYVVVVILLAIAPVVSFLLGNLRFSQYLGPALVVLLIAYQAVVLGRSVELNTLQERLLLPAEYQSLPTHPCEIRNYRLACADLYNECWYSPFPCVPPDAVDANVELRGDTLREGFRYAREQ